MRIAMRENTMKSIAYSLSPVLGGEGRGEGPVARVCEQRRFANRSPLPLTLSPEHRGEGTRSRALHGLCAILIFVCTFASSQSARAADAGPDQYYTLERLPDPDTNLKLEVG